MMEFNGFIGMAKRIEDIDLPRIAAEIGCGEDELHAVMDIEAPGSGFDSRNRPKILFEPHVFYRNLTKEKRDRAVAARLAAAKWKMIPYAKGSQGQYDRLAKAIEIDETAALKACSWGRAQILGENYKLAGYDSVQAMVLDFLEDEDNHLEAMIRFIVATGIDDDLRRHDWAGFARGYNGSRYKENGYDTKLATAFARWRKIKDTPWSVDLDALASAVPTSADVVVTNIAELVGDREIDIDQLPASMVASIQADLRRLNYFTTGKVDGGDGGTSATKGAVAMFQDERNIAVNNRGNINAATLAALEKGPPRLIPAARAGTTLDDLREQDSEIVKEADSAKTAISVGSGTVTTLTLGKAVSDAVSTPTGSPNLIPEPIVATVRESSDFLYYLAPIKAAVSWMPWWLIAVLAAAVAIYVFMKVNRIQLVRLRDERTGLHNGEPDPAAKHGAKK